MNGSSPRTAAVIVLASIFCSGPYSIVRAQLTPGEAVSIADAAKQRPSVSLEFRYTDDMSDSDIESSPQLVPLIKALAGPDLKGSIFVVACHVAASGNTGADQALSERCADRVRGILIKKSGFAADSLIPAGFGSEKAKDGAAPSSVGNQRLEILNMGHAKQE
jgi:outer membrane protein OmpA-like peptidoglycan-associated protein